jgi:hypothetical protein
LASLCRFTRLGGVYELSVKELYDGSPHSWQLADDIAATFMLWITAGRRLKLQREQDPRSPFAFTSERGVPFTTAGELERVGM